MSEISNFAGREDAGQRIMMSMASAFAGSGSSAGSAGRSRGDGAREVPFARRRERAEGAGGTASSFGSAEARKARLVALAKLMDNAFEVPGLGVRFGLDGLIGLLPGAGDAISAAISLYIVYEAKRLGATRGQLARMVGNILIDTAVGAIPVLGDLVDIGFKANVRNLRIMGIDARARNGR